MLVLVVGGGTLGASLARELASQRHTCRVIEQDPARIEQLAEEFADLDVVRGDGCEPVVLETAQISHAQAVVAVTGDDENNLVICLLAKREYGVPMTAARINDPRTEWLFTEDFGVDHAVSSAGVLARLLEEKLAESGNGTS